MVRVKRGNVARKRRKKILQLAKGYRGAHSRLFRVANQQVMKALRYSYVGRKQKKRMFRKIWITRINAASRANGLSYNHLIHNFKKSNIEESFFEGRVRVVRVSLGSKKFKKVFWPCESS